MGSFFELRHDPLVLSGMARASADAAEAELVQDLAHRALVIGHTEALGDEALQVDPAPAHDAMHGPIRACLMHPHPNVSWTGLWIRHLAILEHLTRRASVLYQTAFISMFLAGSRLTGAQPAGACEQGYWYATRDGVQCTVGYTCAASGGGSH